MQNMWVRRPERIRAMISTCGDSDREQYRRDIIERLLFAGCLTGQRLKQTFGEWCDRIVWDESTREIADNPKTIFPADLNHMRQVIVEIKPRAIIAFGKIAGDALCKISNSWILAPHPAARGNDTIQRLVRAKMQLEERFEHHKGEPPIIYLSQYETRLPL